MTLSAASMTVGGPVGEKKQKGQGAEEAVRPRVSRMPIASATYHLLTYLTLPLSTNLLSSSRAGLQGEERGEEERGGAEGRTG